MRARFAAILLSLASPALAQPSTNPPKTVWDSDLDGTAIHRITTMQCPAAAGAFHRDQIQLFDQAGFDVGCNYVGPGSDITLYLTRIDPAQLGQHFTEAEAALKQRLPNAAPRAASLPPPPGFDWHRASYDVSDRRIISDVMMAPLQDWYFEIRVSYVPDQADATGAALAELSALALKTAGDHLAQCKALPDVAHTGKRITDEKTVMGLVMVTGSLMGKVTVRGDAPLPATPDMTPLACAAESFSAGRHQFVYWHDRSQSGVITDRITGIDQDFRATTRDALAMPMDAGLSDTRSGKIAVIVDRADGWDMMAFFDGPPSLNDLAEAALFGHPAGRVSQDGKHITFYTAPKDTAPQPDK